MPEAVFVCLDTSDYMRNGDFSPNRMSAAQETVSLLLSSKMQRNPENTIGFLTMGGKACTVMESLTADADNVMASLTRCDIGGGCNFLHALQIASLALSHRQNPRAEKRIIVLVSAPITEPEKAVEKIAKKLRKDEVAVDIVGFGNEANGAILDKFINVVNKNNNSHYLYVPEGSNLTSAVLASVVNHGEEGMAAAGADGAGGGTAAPGGFEFGIDPNMDPELAMVLRMSLEEEQRRQEAARAAEGGSGENKPAEGDAQPGSSGGAAPAAEGDAAPAEAAPAPPAGDAGPSTGGGALTEEEELERALMLSLQEAEDAAKAEGDEAPKKAEPEQGKQEKEVDEAMQDEDFLAELEKEVDDALKKDEKK